MIGKTRPVWVEIDHRRIAENYRMIRRFVKPGAAIMGIVKADAYGHGAVQVSRTLEACGIDRLAVAMPEEAEELREAGISLPIHVLGELLPEQYPLIAEYKLTPSVGRRETLTGLAEYAGKRGIEIPVHLICDTGMGRLGPFPAEVPGFVRAASNLKGLRVEGLMTHLARGDEADGIYTQMQWIQFRRLMEAVDAAGLTPPYYHIANSPGLALFPEMHLQMVRPGIILYGMRPSLSFETPFPLMPALSWKARLVHIKEVPEGHGVSYSSVYQPAQTERIGILPLGYEDGYKRHLSNKGEVLIRGKRVPIRGRLCMDQLMVGLDTVPEAQVGDEAVLLGRQGDEEITAHELGSAAGTLNYDITCAISPRVPVIHLRE